MINWPGTNIPISRGNGLVKRVALVGQRKRAVRADELEGSEA